jgi:hypothetical protein
VLIASFFAMAASAWAVPIWAIASSSSPTNFVAGDESGDDAYVLTVVNVGSEAAGASKIEVEDTLPAGIKAASISGEDLGGERALSCSLAPKLACTYEGFAVAPGDVLQIRIAVTVESTVISPAVNSITVGAGGAVTEAAGDPTTIGSTPASFGVAGFTSAWADAHAAAHANVSTNIAFNQVETNGEARPAGDVKDVKLELPEGAVANAQAVPSCTIVDAVADECPQSTAVGVVFSQESSGTGGVPVWDSSLIYSIVPTPKEPAAFMFAIAGIPVWIEESIGAENDYRITWDAKGLPAAALLSMTMTWWDVPAQLDGGGPDHTSSGASFGGPGAIPLAPFLTNPGTCPHTPLESTLSVDSWENEGVFVKAFAAGLQLTGCEAIAFAPSLEVQPDILEADAPSGYAIDVRIPQPEVPSGLSTAELKTAKVTLPAGVGISLPMALGLTACSEANIGLHSAGPDTCPLASTLGTVEISTPLLPSPLQGHIFLAEPYANPFHSLVGLYVAATGAAGGDGVFLKLAGQISADPSTGRPSLTFDPVPQLPLSELRLRFNGGPRAPFTSPSSCGTATSTGEVTPWSGDTPTRLTSFFLVSGCATEFAPSLEVAATSNPNGSYRSIKLAIARYDEEQELGGFEISIPSTVESKLAQAQLCGEVEAAEGTCPSASKVGKAVVVAGLGSHPLQLPGYIYLTGPYRNGQAGLSISIPMVAGPFDLGGLVVRTSIQVDAAGGKATIVSDALPTIVDGIPLHLDEVSLVFEGDELEVNPITCEPFAVAGTVMSTEETSAPVVAMLPAAGCKGPASDLGLSGNPLPTIAPAVTQTKTVKKRVVGKTKRTRRCSARHRKKAKRKLKCRSPRHRASTHKRGHKPTKRPHGT